MMGWLITSRINWTSNLKMLCTHSLPLNINPPRRASAVIVSQSTRSRIFVTFFHKMRPLFLDEKGNYCTSQFCYLLRSLVRYSNSRNLLFNSLTSFASFEKKNLYLRVYFTTWCIHGVTSYALRCCCRALPTTYFVIEPTLICGGKGPRRTKWR